MAIRISRSLTEKYEGKDGFRLIDYSIYHSEKDECYFYSCEVKADEEDLKELMSQTDDLTLTYKKDPFFNGQFMLTVRTICDSVFDLTMIANFTTSVYKELVFFENEDNRFLCADEAHTTKIILNERVVRVPDYLVRCEQLGSESFEAKESELYLIRLLNPVDNELRAFKVEHDLSSAGYKLMLFDHKTAYLVFDNGGTVNALIFTCDGFTEIINSKELSKRLNGHN